MNIEEERKAFLEAMKPKLIAAFGCGCLEEGYDKDTFNNENAQEFFECWLAAKAHAAEMSRIPCELWEALSSEWRVLTPGTLNDVSDMQPKFDTEHDALEWIKANNYRVIK